MIDNFEKLNKLLEFDTEDDFYMLQVIKRRKENPELKKNSVSLKTLYLQRKGQLLGLKDDLTELANKHNARVYLNPNRKSFRKCTLACLKEFADRIYNENYNKPYKVFESVAGASGTNKPIWIIDVDWFDGLEESFKIKMVEEICSFVNSLQPTENTNKIVLLNNTKNGIHILTTPFNMKDFHEKYNIKVHKNNPTLVYCK